jgi:hypothetical protein
MRFWLVMGRLLVDRWEYADHGVRDRTHLRIFTRRSLHAFVEAASLEVLAQRRNTRLLDDQSRIGRAGSIATRIARTTIARVPPFREFLTYQYVLVASRR